MESTDLKKKLLRYLDTADERLLRVLEAVVESYQDERDTLERYNEEIDQAIEEIERGEYLTQEDARKLSEKW